MLQLALFILFGAICVAGAINLLVQKHPINSALSLVVVMGSLALIYLLLGAEFVAAVQVIVYAGAIMVLFVFVIMLLNAGAEERTEGSRVALWIGGPGVTVLAGIIMWLVTHSDKTLGGITIHSMGINQPPGMRMPPTMLRAPYHVTAAAPRNTMAATARAQG